jgi:NAD(P) transhydrogenase subunit alpha
MLARVQGSQALIIGILNESCWGERRVALTPTTARALIKRGNQILLEHDAGREADFADEEYAACGATVLRRQSEVAQQAEILILLRWPDVVTRQQQLMESFNAHKIVIGLLDPLSRAPIMQTLAASGATAFALELVPRTTRAQVMDVMSSMATLSGYKAAILAANASPRIFPLVMTAAGTIAAAKVFVLGVGVAGLQAIATARRLGAIVTAWDMRPATQEQVESLGAKFARLDLPAFQAEGEGGYAQSVGENQLAQQHAALQRVLAEQNVIITTAAVPGRPAPVLITRAMVESMKPGTLIIDLAAERGGNCELSRSGQTVTHHQVTILAPIDLPGMLPVDASQLFAQNVAAFLGNLIKHPDAGVDWADQIVAESLVCREGQVVNDKVKNALAQLEPANADEVTVAART